MIKLIDIIKTTPGLEYHLKHKLPISENIYRYSSDAFVNLFGEARELWKTGMLELPLPDVELLETTDIGKWGIYEGQKVPLDLPMLDESGKDMSTDDEIDYKKRLNLNNFYLKEIVSPPDGIYREDWLFSQMQEGNKDVLFLVTSHPGIHSTKEREIFKKAKELGYGALKVDHKAGGEAFFVYVNTPKAKTKAEKLLKIANSHGGYLADKTPEEAREIGKLLDYDPKDTERYIARRYNQTNLKKESDLARKILSLNEAEYKGKDVQLNKPKRGGPKKFYVYVKDPKTGNVKKVNFGAEGGGQNLAIKFKEPGARASFAARHDCANKKDKTTPGYWSCRIPRYWKSLGGDSNFSGFW